MAKPAKLTVLAHLPHCDGGECPTIYSDEAGNVGIKGSVEPGAEKEHISWMTAAEFKHLLSQLK